MSQLEPVSPRVAPARVANESSPSGLNRGLMKRMRSGTGSAPVVVE
jgi:hypothetical protein